MTSYVTLDYLPDLTASKMSSAIALVFEPYTPISSLIDWDRSATYYTSSSYALLNSTFSWSGREGATYDIFSSSYFDPYLIQVFDNLGNVIATDTSNTSDTYGTDYVRDFIAPYSGIYYVSAGWHQGSAPSNKFVTLSIYEDEDTANIIPPSPVISNESNTLDVIVDQGVISNEAVLLKGLIESITYENSTITSHTVTYGNTIFNYSSIDEFIMPVIRNSEFTQEFKNEILDYVPSASEINYQDAVMLVGINNIDGVILNVAGADGQFVL